MKAILRVFHSKLASGAGIYFLANTLNGLLPFLLLPVLTRYLSPTEYGELGMFQVFVSILGALCGLNVTGAALRKYYDYQEPAIGMPDFIFACITVLMLSTTVTLFILVAFFNQIQALMSLPGDWIIFGIIVAFFNFLILIRLGQWQVRKSPVKYGAFQVTLTFFNLILSLSLVIIFKMGVDGRLIGIGAASVLFGFVAIILLAKDRLISISWRPDLMREALAYGIPMMPHILGTYLLTSVDRVLITNLEGLESLGYYIVAFQFSLVLKLTLTSFHQAFTPWLYDKLSNLDQTEVKKIKDVKRLYFFTLVFMVIAGFVLSEKAVTLIAGSDYKHAAEVLPWLITAQAIRGLYGLESGFVVYAKRNTHLAKVTFLSGGLHILLALILIQGFGLLGVAYSFCISSLLQWVWTRSFVMKIFGKNYLSLSQS